MSGAGIFGIEMLADSCVRLCLLLQWIGDDNWDWPHKDSGPHVSATHKAH